MTDASNAKVLVLVRFRSRLSADELRRRYKERLPEFRKIEGLLQKYYVYNESTEEWGGVYLWDSAESVQKYMDSDLRKSIASAYEVDGAPQIERFSLLDTLR